MPRRVTEVKLYICMSTMCCFNLWFRHSTYPCTHILQVVFHEPGLLHALQREADAIIRSSITVETKLRAWGETR